MTSYRLNEAHNGIEITFSSRPEADTLATLKTNGFRWHRGGGYWYAKQTPERLALAEQIANGATEAPKTEAAPEDYYTTLTDGYMGAIESTGSVYASGKCLYGAELSKAIREALKKCSIGGVSVRVSTYAGGQSIGVTVKATEADTMTEAEYIESTKTDLRGIWFVTPEGEQIHRDSIPWHDTERAAAIIEATHRQEYHNIIKDMHGYGHQYHSGEPFKAAFVNKIEAIKRILNAFNHDDSNSMVDYFDRHFYEDIIIKAA